MTILTFTVLVWLGSLAAGFVGSLTGLGGGVVIVPLLVLVFGVNIRYAIGASLVSVIHIDWRSGRRSDTSPCGPEAPAEGVRVGDRGTCARDALQRIHRETLLLEGPSPDDRAVAVWLGRILRVGVAVAASIITCGGAAYLWRRGAAPTDYQTFRGEPASFRTVHGILSSAGSGSGRGLIQLGLLVLIVTPIARVAASIVGFAHERDWLYVAITLSVLMLLGFSLLGS